MVNVLSFLKWVKGGKRNPPAGVRDGVRGPKDRTERLCVLFVFVGEGKSVCPGVNQRTSKIFLRMNMIRHGVMCLPQPEVRNTAPSGVGATLRDHMTSVTVVTEEVPATKKLAHEHGLSGTICAR